MARFGPPAAVIAQTESSRVAYGNYTEESDAYAGELIRGSSSGLPDPYIVIEDATLAGEGWSAGPSLNPINRFVAKIRQLVTPQTPAYLLAPATNFAMQPDTRMFAKRALAYTMRRESGQFAQRFSGQHTRTRVGAQMPNRAMMPPRRARLTVRPTPRSFGSTTEVIGSDA